MPIGLPVQVLLAVRAQGSAVLMGIMVSSPEAPKDHPVGNLTTVVR